MLVPPYLLFFGFLAALLVLAGILWCAKLSLIFMTKKMRDTWLGLDEDS